MRKLEDLVGKKVEVGVIAPDDNAGYTKAGFEGVVESVQWPLVLVAGVDDGTNSGKTADMWVNVTSLVFVGITEV